MAKKSVSTTLEELTRISTLHLILAELEGVCEGLMDEADTDELKQSYAEMAHQLHCVADRARRYRV